MCVTWRIRLLLLVRDIISISGRVAGNWTGSNWGCEFFEREMKISIFVNVVEDDYLTIFKKIIGRKDIQIYSKSNAKIYR